MRSRKKKWLLTACILIAAGILLFTAALAAASFDITKLDTQNYQRNEYHFPDAFDSI